MGGMADVWARSLGGPCLRQPSIARRRRRSHAFRNSSRVPRIRPARRVPLRLHFPEIPMRKRLISIAATAALLSTLPTPLLAQAPDTALSAQRQVVTRADQLPRRTVTLDKLPSDYLAAPLATLRP